MMLDAKKKARIIAKFKTHEKDTGSAEVQIAILSEEIKELTKHLQQHKHDHSSRRGLLKKLGERRRLLRYLESENEAGYKKLIETLKLKPSKRSQKEAEIKRILEEEAAEESDSVSADSIDAKDEKEEETNDNK
ncbi:30S ribosomal protein S15 [Candidatus Falkowbacteria bacterium]|nr:30S ribosomal protein S15 [Candidatus Falkowbacteria bacterium]MBT7007773.1 30S ribosomal protein S15 [Candidatus Falkowbacteria bacterium]